jgi:hypothetical protein
LEPSLGWTEAGVLASATSYFVLEGEEGGLSVAELDRIRAKRRAAASQQPAGGGDAKLVYVSLRPDGAVRDVRPLTAAEQAAVLRKAKSV